VLSECVFIPTDQYCIVPLDEVESTQRPVSDFVFHSARSNLLGHRVDSDYGMLGNRVLSAELCCKSGIVKRSRI